RPSEDHRRAPGRCARRLHATLTNTSAWKLPGIAIDCPETGFCAKNQFARLLPRHAAQFAPAARSRCHLRYVRVRRRWLAFGHGARRAASNPRCPFRQSPRPRTSPVFSASFPLGFAAAQLVYCRRFAHFSHLPLEARRKILLSWCDSALPQRRAAFQALRKAVAHFYTSLPSPANSRSPVWTKLHYPGPLGAPTHTPSQKVLPLRFDRDTTLTCDVCIVASGAGGGTAAGVLAAAGLDVAVLEAGGHYDDADFDGAQYTGFGRLYWQGGGAATVDHSVGLLAGTCLGGGTVINYTTAFRTPDDIPSEWAA